MREHLETELKWALRDAEVHARLALRLGELLGPARRLEQENRFFDSRDARLRTARFGLRLRRENDRLILTCKQRVSHDQGLHRHQEWEGELDPALWPTVQRGAIRAADLPLPEAVTAALAGAPLVAIGGFANLRQEWHRDGELVCLDRTDFGGRRVDHELEVETETPGPSAAFWRSRFAEWAIPCRPQTVSKFARLLELLSDG